MCYDVKYIYQKQLKRAKEHSDIEAIKEIEEQIEQHFPKQVFHVSGFSHPKMFIYTQEDSRYPKLSTWGLIPFWVKDMDSANKMRNMCLNAVGETIFDKPSFRASAKERRGVVFLEGYYEHFHLKNKKYPFYIYGADNNSLPIATLYDEWTDKKTGETINTFSIVTTPANNMMSKIHNKKKRMPLIIPYNVIDDWLAPINNKTDKEMIDQLIRSCPDELTNAHPVGRLKGPNAIGNVPEVTNKIDYPELVGSVVAEYC